MTDIEVKEIESFDEAIGKNIELSEELHNKLNVFSKNLRLITTGMIVLILTQLAMIIWVAFKL